MGSEKLANSTSCILDVKLLFFGNHKVNGSRRWHGRGTSAIIYLMPVKEARAWETPLLEANQQLREAIEHEQTQGV